MADIVNPIPYELSNFGVTTSDTYSLDSYEFDYALGGIPFLSATRDQWPYTEGMAEIRKQQFDSFQEPGEQSLYGWWLRSQSTFNAGAGVLYQDPDSDNQFNYRFADSLGIDPWTSGQISLLRQMVVNTPTPLVGAVSRVSGYIRPGGQDAAFLLDGTSLYSIQSGSNTPITMATAGTALDLTSAGVRSLALLTDGVWSSVDTAAATKMWSFPSPPTTGCIEYVKGRVMVGIGGTLYLNVINTGATASIDAADVFSFTHPDPTWVWTSISEGPAAIYAAGRNSTQSMIYKITVSFDDLGGETFTPLVTATMPTGELVTDIYGYIGSFMGIATTKGFRVGEFDSNGDVIYGPLLFQPAGGCQGIVGFDRFMFVGSTAAHDGSSGVFRVDLGNIIQEQTSRAVRYAYARDAYAEGRSGSIRSVTMLGASDRLVFPVTNSAIMVQASATLVPTGYLKTGRIRYNTEEPKLYKFASLRTPTVLQGTVQFSVLTQGGAEIPYITYGPTFSPAQGDVAITNPGGPQNWIAFKFTLARGTVDQTTGGILNGWQVKALPGSIRQRLISHTFLLFDNEEDKGGQKVGTNGYARERFEAFKSLARAGDVVTLQELKEDISTLVIIDDWKYTQLAPPGPDDAVLGGYLTVVLRTVAESA